MVEGSGENRIWYCVLVGCVGQRSQGIGFGFDDFDYLRLREGVCILHIVVVRCSVLDFDLVCCAWEGYVDSVIKVQRRCFGRVTDTAKLG